MNIHGAWFDPSNPVVQFGGSLRTDLFNWLIQSENKIDLCLCLGTSLSGMNADRTANTPAKKSLKDPPKALGTVIINIQRTSLDSKSAVRIWAKLDDVFKMIAEQLGLTIKPIQLNIPTGDVFVVPYDSEGKRSDQVKTTWDLRDGAGVRVCVAGAMNYGDIGKIHGKRDEHYSVELIEKKRPVRRLLGAWWVDCALRGTVPQLPIVNLKTKVLNVSSDGSTEPSDNEPEEVEVEEKVKETKPVFDYPLPKEITIVQSHFIVCDKNSGDNKHSWGLQLGNDNMDKYINDVVWSLHSTFKDPEVKCTQPPYEVGRRGWGTFTVKVAISLKNGTVLRAKHSLTFDKEGDAVKTTVVPTSS